MKIERYRAVLTALAFTLAFVVTQAFPQSTPIASLISRPDINDSDRVDLFNEQGTCPNEAKRALFTYRKAAPRQLGGTKVEGCWAMIEQRIYMMFEDGDRVALPTQDFNWVSGKPPATPM